jgi:hypothetical protein
VKSNHLLIALMVSILVAVLALIAVVVSSGPGVPPIPDPDKDKTTDRDHRPTPPHGERPKPPEKPINDPALIRQSAQEGKTYDIILKLGAEGEGTAEDWGVRQACGIVFYSEAHIVRTIEKNDGKRIVELRRIASCKQTKLHAKVKNVRINMGLPGVLLLGAIEETIPGTTSAVEFLQPFVEKLLASASQSGIDEKVANLQKRVDSLSGKTVRIEYVDGVGVTDLTPVGCDLDESERDFLMRTALLSDCYLFPDHAVKVGDHWPVKASQLAGYFDPSLRACPAGDITILRASDSRTKDNRITANLQMPPSTIVLDNSTPQRASVGRFTTTEDSTIHFDLDNSYVTDAELKGTIYLSDESKDHFYFKESFSFEPTVTIQYWCGMK